jgi:MFS-type transporter involved in bile tolerance (Atg22 family)
MSSDNAKISPTVIPNAIIPTLHNSGEQPETLTKKELHGWYMYDFANGAFFYSVLNFLPILIVGQASDVAQTEFCGECLNDEWAIDYEITGACIGANSTEGGCLLKDTFTATTCLAQEGDWQADWKDDAKLVMFLGSKVT